MKMRTLNRYKSVPICVVGLMTTGCPTDESHGLQVMMEAGPAPANLSCLGRWAPPEGGPQVEMTVPAIAFGQTDEEGNPLMVPGLEIQIFPDNRIPEGASCGECTMATDLGNGFYSFAVPEEAWFAYRVVENAGTMGPPVLRTSEVNFESGSDEAFNVMYGPVLDGLHQQLGIPRVEGSTLSAGRFVDCDGAPVQGATVRILDSSGDVIREAGQGVTLYFGDAGPDPELSETSFVGRWSVANLPVPSDGAYVEMRAPDGTLVACEPIPVTEDGFSVLRARPLREGGNVVCDALR